MTSVIESKPWFEITETGLVIHSEYTDEQWQELGGELAKNAKSLMWLIGDWLLAGETKGYLPRGKLDQACERFGIAYKTAAEARSVCARVQSSIRMEHLTFSHHQIVAGRDDAAELLAIACDRSMTVEQLREEKKKRQRLESPKKSIASGSTNEAAWSFQLGDCRSIPYPDDHFDLVFCSPPYEAQRAYAELDFNLTGEEWVAWATECYMECLRVSKGLVAWIVEGYTNDFAYTSTPFLLHADLHRRGVKMRKVVVYQRNGIPGTGGPEWLRNDWEPIICGTKNGRLPWADNTAMGSPPKQNKPRVATNRNKDGSRKSAVYNDPEVCNPGNIITGLVGSGGMGWKDATRNEAPFPEWIAEFFIKSFCPPGGTVLDPFSGSGTTVSVAVKNGRNGVGIDARETQVWLGETRLLGMSIKERESGQKLLL